MCDLTRLKRKYTCTSGSFSPKKTQNPTTVYITYIGFKIVQEYKQHKIRTICRQHKILEQVEGQKNNKGRKLRFIGYTLDGADEFQLIYRKGENTFLSM